MPVGGVTREREQLSLQPRAVEIGDPREVVQQPADGDARRVSGQFRHVLADMIIEGQLAGVLQHHDAERRELLAAACHVELGLRRDWRCGFQVGAAVTRQMHDLAVLDHRNGKPRHRLGPPRHDPVYLDRKPGIDTRLHGGCPGGGTS